WHRYLSIYHFGNVFRASDDLRYGKSVRCVRDAE
ncbi:MAG: hypothetical protein RLZZ314_700, partial [Bacteroidota bacterium]